MDYEKRLFRLLLTGFLLFSCLFPLACGFAEAAYNTNEISMRYTLSTEEWGAAVSRVILSLPGTDTVQAGDLDPSAFTVRIEKNKCEILDLYPSDTEGAKTDADSGVITFELKKQDLAPKSNSAIMTESSLPEDGLAITVSLKEDNSFVIGGKKYNQFSFIGKGDASNRIAPELEGENLLRSSYTYHDETVVGSAPYGDISLCTIAYEPASLKNDGQKNPLIVWLHGAGEGGSDIDRLLIGTCDVEELWGERIQKYFETEGGQAGAYVFAPQCPEMWATVYDPAATGTDADPAVAGSKYTLAVKSALDDYIAQNGDIDLARIYIGGPSNGGFMTLEMLSRYPDRFAGAYCLCPNLLPSDDALPEARLEALSRQNIWFIASLDDPIIPVKSYSLILYAKLKHHAADSNIHYSLCDTVSGIENAQAKYNGHYVQVYLLNDTPLYDFETEKVLDHYDDILNREAKGISPNSIWSAGTIVPADESGPLGAGVPVMDESGTGYISIWQWLASLRKQP